MVVGEIQRCARPECANNGLMQCGRCLTAWYCSVRCQTVHWCHGHREDCVEAAPRPPDPGATIVRVATVASVRAPASPTRRPSSSALQAALQYRSSSTENKSPEPPSRTPKSSAAVTLATGGSDSKGGQSEGPRCCACQRHKPRCEFTAPQLKKVAEKRRCKACIAANANAAVAPGATRCPLCNERDEASPVVGAGTLCTACGQLFCGPCTKSRPAACPQCAAPFSVSPPTLHRRLVALLTRPGSRTLKTVAQYELADFLLQHPLSTGELLVGGGAAVSEGWDDPANLLTLAAEGGHCRAEFALGELARTTVPPDYPAAIEWYNRAATGHGNLRAHARIGELYAAGGGGGLVRDDARALAAFRRAADGGDPLGFHGLGRAYEMGRGVAHSYPEAFRQYSRASEMYHPPSLHKVGSMYENGYGVSANLDEAVRWYNLAAERGEVRAMRALGRLFRCGSGHLSKDIPLAAVWLERAADAGDGGAQNALAGMYLGGHGVEVNVEKAVDLYRRAAAQNMATSCYTLGCMYGRGDHGVQVDVEKAIPYLEYAVAEGYTEPVALLAALKKARDEGDVSNRRQETHESHPDTSEQQSARVPIVQPL